MALSGDYVVVKMADQWGTMQTFNNGDIYSVDLGLTYDQFDVTGFSDHAHHFIEGHMQAPVTVRGFLTTAAVSPGTTGTHPIFEGVLVTGVLAQFRVAIGNNAAPQTGVSPEYSGTFIVTNYTTVVEDGKAVMFTAQLKPGWTTTPVWGLMQ